MADRGAWTVPMESIRVVENPRDKEDGRIMFSLPSLLGRSWMERNRLTLQLDFAGRNGSLKGVG